MERIFQKNVLFFHEELKNKSDPLTPFCSLFLFSLQEQQESETRHEETLANVSVLCGREDSSTLCNGPAIGRSSADRASGSGV